MRLGLKERLAFTRDRMDALRLYALKHGNAEALKAYVQKYGNFNTLKQHTIAPKSIGRKLLTAFAIALTAAVIAMLLSVIPPLNGTVRNVDEAIYDSFYKRRPSESKFGGDVVMLTVDDDAIQKMRDAHRPRWPWPRDTWAAAVRWLEKCGAKVVVFDIFFEDPSNYEAWVGDDTAFAGALDDAKMPIVIGEQALPNGEASFALPVKKKPTFGAVNIASGTLRSYRPETHGVPALALQAVRRAGAAVPEWANSEFLLHYYGPTRLPDGGWTFHQISALDVILAAQPDAPPMPKITPELFRNRIVLIGVTANAFYDVKSSPISQLYPGAEMQATAITNLLENRRVVMLGWGMTLTCAFFGSMLATTGARSPRRAWIKLVVPIVAISITFFSGYLLFVKGHNIYWLRLAVPLLACGFATVAALAWTYLVEDRQKRVLRKFLAQYVSPEVAAELDRRGTISLGGVEREMSVVFTDIAGFTDLTEQLPVEQLERFMNYYLSEMSAVVFDGHGTLDKYIGDAIMTFWNAPLDQEDHAIRACRTALNMKNRENELRPALKEMGAGNILTRIGVNTAKVKVGNYGSLQKLNYTVLGDGVNLASRLEGANKLYGSQILVAQPTVEAVKDHFLFRQLDLLRVKGKKKPMAVFELIAEGAGDPQQQKIAKEFDLAFAAYQQQDWDRAEELLVALSEFAPDDVPTQTYLKRVRAFRASPPPADWDGVHIAKDK